MPIIRKQNTSSRVVKRTIIAACFLLTTLVALLFITHFQETQKKPPQDTKQDSISKEPTPAKQHPLPEADHQFLVAHGLDNPVTDIVNDLMKHNELIPCKGSVGGVPGFYNPAGITILSKSRVEAVYDDGHVVGTVELTFKVSNGVIRWKIKKVECGE